jgi:hypothetical protein
MTGNDNVTAHILPQPQAEAAAIERATDIYRALLAAIDAHIDRENDPAQVVQLHADAQRYAEEQYALDATDHTGLQRVIDQYPALVRNLQATLG